MIIELSDRTIYLRNKGKKMKYIDNIAYLGVSFGIYNLINYRESIEKEKYFNKLFQLENQRDNFTFVKFGRAKNDEFHYIIIMKKTYRKFLPNNFDFSLNENDLKEIQKTKEKFMELGIPWKNPQWFFSGICNIE